jgi:hypothetical protein
MRIFILSVTFFLYIKAIYHPDNRIELRNNGRTMSWTFPIIGIPNAESIHKTEAAYPETAFVVYDGLGLDKISKNYLQWLNTQLRIKSTKIPDVYSWLQKIQ